MNSRNLKRSLIVVASIAVLSQFISPLAIANEYDAKNFITVATGNVPSPSDPAIHSVARQLDLVQVNCASSGIHDKLAKGHSLLTVRQSLLQLLADFVQVSRVQCSRIEDVTLISLYVLERNAGASHAATIGNLTRNAPSLVAKWRSIPPSKR